ncbi:MAG: D-alanyl-D-alanine carboxypeptidase, partial [Clostridia bacterium]|nr:D-alanyl-D-alanine carboxypeptidase [Clostridia bacterium]
FLLQCIVLLYFKYTTIWMDTIRNGAFGLANTNKLIRFYNGATGMKTGYTSKAKFCLSATAKRDNMQLIAVVLGGETSDDRFSCAKQLLDYGFANYMITTPERLTIEPINVLHGKKSTARLTYDDSSLLTEKGKSAVETKFEVKENVEAPIKTGDIVGVVRYYINGTEVGNTPITVCEDVERMDLLTMLKNIWECLTNVF